MTSYTEGLYQEALAKLKARLTDEELQDLKSVTLVGFKQELQKMQKTHEDTIQVKGLTRLRSFISTFEKCGKCFELAPLSNGDDMMNYLWGPMRLLLQAANAGAGILDSVLAAYDVIGEACEEIPILEQYGAAFEDSPEVREVLVMILVDIMKFHKEALPLVRGPTWRQAFRPMWQNFQRTIDQTKGNMKRHKLQLSKLAQIKQIKDSQQHHMQMKLFLQKVEMEDQKERLEAIEKERRDRIADLKAVRDWIYPDGSNAEDHRTFREVNRQCSGTGEWILEDKKVKEWKDSETPSQCMLWLTGIHGTGKTILASLIIEECQLRDPDFVQDLRQRDPEFVERRLRDRSFRTAAEPQGKEPPFRTSYFYCKYHGDKGRNTCLSIMKGLVAQMLDHVQSRVPYCIKKRSHSIGSNLESIDVARELLEMFCKEIPRQFIIVDGLDECAEDQRHRFLKILTDIVRTCEGQAGAGKPRVLIVSRRVRDIEKDLQGATPIHLGRVDNEQDIKQFAQQESRRLASWLNEEQIRYVCEETCKNSDGMFLFAKLVLDNLNSQSSQEHLIREMNKFPKKLKDAYDRVIARIKESLEDDGAKWEQTCTLLGWLVAAKRPLNWHELQAVLCIETGGGEVVMNEKKRFGGEITHWCGSLVQLVGGSRVELIHHTARQYIIENEQVNTKLVHFEMTLTCLRYLECRCFDVGIADNEVKEEICQGYLSFQEYAVSKWFDHLRTVIEDSAKLLTGAEECHSDDFLKALEDFYVKYLAEPAEGKDKIPAEKTQEALASAREDCKAYMGTSFEDYLVDTWAHVLRHQQLDDKERDTISIPILRKAVERNRKSIEALATGGSTAEKEKLARHHGPRPFKCPRLTCQLFHEGFATAKDRDEHVRRHDRPLRCLEPTCNQDWGFSSSKDLEMHMRRFHPVTFDLARSFTPLSRETLDPAKAKFRCSLCSRVFTRKLNLDAHKLNHEGKRPFGCDECGKHFARVNDLRRHEQIHVRRLGMRR